MEEGCTGAKKTDTSQGDGNLFSDLPKYDEVRERLEIIGIKMDLHKNGVMYLKEMDILLKALDKYQRDSVGNFLLAYMKQTKRQTIPLPAFVNNIEKAYKLGKFGLRKMIECSLVEKSNPTHRVSDSLKEESLRQILDKVENKEEGSQKGRKPMSPKPPLTLQERIEAQKKKLKSEKRDGVRKSKKISNPPPIKKTQFSHQSSQISLYHMSEEISLKSPSETAQSRSRPNPRNTKSSLNVRMKQQYAQKQNKGSVSPDRFDQNNFVKASTAFNKGIDFSQSSIRKEVHGDASFTEQLLRGNRMSRFAPKLPENIPVRALSTDERMLKSCTFRPKLEKCPQRYSRVKPRLLSHFDNLQKHRYQYTNLSLQTTAIF